MKWITRQEGDRTGKVLGPYAKPPMFQTTEPLSLKVFSVKGMQTWIMSQFFKFLRVVSTSFIVAWDQAWLIPTPLKVTLSPCLQFRADISINTPAMQPTHFFWRNISDKQTKKIIFPREGIDGPRRRWKGSRFLLLVHVGVFTGTEIVYKQNVFRVLGLSFRDIQFCTWVSARKTYVVTSFILVCLFVFYELVSYPGKLCLLCTKTSALHFITKTIH